MELVLRFLDGENEMVHRECWVESSSASPPKSEWVKEEKQADMRLIIKPKKKMIHFAAKRRPQRRISSLNHFRRVIFSEWSDHHLDHYSATYTIVVYKTTILGDQ